ncbi:a2c5fa0e-308f-4a95-bbbc-85a084562b52-CDS [Sclerotinia trifoliorum]|uniref:A2c5fa0e-308f-4a95-bbbc-85a084562b52-CDS n=1 Tax=Sclerotinia trifoliorum TaxID=28548 RepID=A0A8H2VLB4_9HELO|nr:a2c5fa0e-308f-4a95-bbbc-85a084562b52-CDS [Sclerotinia trifoliorum]
MPRRRAPASPEATNVKIYLNKLYAPEYQYPAIIHADTNRSSSPESGNDTGSGGSTRTGSESPKHKTSEQKPPQPQNAERDIKSLYFLHGTLKPFPRRMPTPLHIPQHHKNSSCGQPVSGIKNMEVLSTTLWQSNVIIRERSCTNGCVDVYCDGGCVTCPEVSGLHASTTVPRFISGGSPTDHGHCYECEKNNKEELL